MSDAWVANISDGRTIVERWTLGEDPPWARLMSICQEKSLWITNLRMTICSETVSLPSHASGYWQAYRRATVGNVPAEHCPIIRGIGHVTNGVIRILWGVRTPMNTAYFWEDSIPVDGQTDIVWKPR